MTTSNQFIAFFGATGGCTNVCLAHTLNACYNATALARTPSKLIDMLISQGVTQDKIDHQLKIIKGDISDLSAIKNVLLSINDNGGSPLVASHIISGIGGAPKFQKSIKRPITIDNPTICTTGITNIMQVLREIYHEYPSMTETKPSITVISSTGISSVQEDVPFGFQTLYHVILKRPHEDKKAMEQLVVENMNESNESQRLFRGVICVRPSLLMGDHDIKKGKGYDQIKVGSEDQPAIGYTIHRADVGEWMYENVIKSGGESYFGQKVTLTN
jgi:hypothetical protein